MAIGAHADDIELNVGGTLAKYREMGYDVVYVMSTNNMSGGWSKLRPDGIRETRLPPFDEIMPQRKLEAAACGCGHAETFTICNQGCMKPGYVFTAEILEHKK